MSVAEGPAGTFEKVKAASMKLKRVRLEIINLVFTNGQSQMADPLVISVQGTKAQPLQVTLQMLLRGGAPPRAPRKARWLLKRPPRAGKGVGTAARWRIGDAPLRKTRRA